MDRRDFLKLCGLIAVPPSILAATVHPTGEYERCKADPAYFIDNYVKIRGADSNIVPLRMRPQQVQVVHSWRAGGDTNYSKDRQVGMTTIAMAYALWLIAFHDNTPVLVVAAREGCAHHAANIFRLMQYSLPTMMQPRVFASNRLEIKLRNGSSIKFCSHWSMRTMHGKSYHTAFLDEPAWFDDFDEVNRSVTSTSKNIASYSSDGPNRWGIYRRNVPNKTGYIQESAS